VESIKKYCGLNDYEIIVTDSESTAYNKLFVKENFPDLLFVGFKDNVGYAKLVNAGIKMSRGDFILILNVDIIITKDSVEKLLEFIKSNREVGLIGPRLLQFNGKSQNSCFHFYTPLTVLYRRTFLGKLPFGRKNIDNFLMKKDLEGLRDNNKKYLEVDWIMGSAMMARREAINKVGFLDENYFMYFEDVDWAKRFWDNDYTVVYYPESKMYHYHQKISSKKGGLFDIIINKYTRIHIKSALRYFWKHGIKLKTKN
jgi:N-acetylglucosaminyl-diphospho-decaprenol L-rhamnosyltransferase